ncbi:hypothetical protein OAC15_00670 [Alphaproteobacteria bacterium]|nr:hypothetical protein [Alphaproteobacteria bacterium]
MLIQEITKKKNIKLEKIENFKKIDELANPSLFEDKYAYLIETNAIKNNFEDIDKIKDKSKKFFIFLNYAIYKKNPLNSVQLNAYDYKKDIAFFSRTNESFNSFDDTTKNEFLTFSYINPHLFFSELQKSAIQTLILGIVDGYNPDTILSIRKEIFKYKGDFSAGLLPKLYNLLKKEVRIKKFNF